MGKLCMLFGYFIVLLFLVTSETHGEICTGDHCPTHQQKPPDDGGGGGHHPPPGQHPPPRTRLMHASNEPRPTVHPPRQSLHKVPFASRGPRRTLRGPSRWPKPTPMLKERYGGKDIPFENRTEKLKFFGSFYREFIEIHRVHKMKLNDSMEQSVNKTLFQEKKKAKLMDLFRRLFKTITHAERQLKPSIGTPGHDPKGIADSAKRDFEAFKAMFSRKLEENTSAWKRDILREKAPLKNATEYKRFIEQNLKNVSRVFHVVLDWWLKVRPKPVEHIKWRPCEKDCQNIERMVAFCKRQARECEEEDDHKGDATREVFASIRRQKPPGENPERGCDEGKKRCPVQFQCVPRNRPCIDDQDVFPDDEDDEERNRPFSRSPAERREHGEVLPSEAPRDGHIRAAMRTPRLQPTTMLPDGLDMRIREFFKRNPDFMNDDRRHSARSRIFPTAVLEAMRDSKPSVLAGLISAMKDKHGFDLRPYIYPTRSSNGPDGKMRLGCSPLCPGKNMSFCWAEMRCVKRGMKCSIKHLIAMMNSTRTKDHPACQKDEFFCPIFMQCKTSRAECSPEKFMESCPLRNKTCGPENGYTRGNSSETIEEDKVFRLRCPASRKYCPESSGCIRRNESCPDDRRLSFSGLKQVPDEKRVFCRIRNVICPRVYKYWKAMRPGCMDRDHLQRNKTDASIGRDNGRTVKPKRPHTVRPAASPPHGRPHRPHSVPADANKPHESPNMPHLRMESGVHRSVVASQIWRNPEIQPVSLPTVFVKYDHSLIELMGGRLELIAVAVPKRNIPVQWKCTLLDGQRRGRWHARERNVEFPQVNNQGKMSSGLLLPTRCRLSVQPTSQSFYGAVVLKYTKVASNQNIKEFQAAQIASNAPVGDLVFLISPMLPQVNLKLIAKDHIEIIGNEQDQKSFKVKDVMRLSNFSMPHGLRIPPQLKTLIDQNTLHSYKTRLEKLGNTSFQIACVGYADRNPLSKGKWYLKTSNLPWKLFPERIPSRDDKPLLLKPGDQIKFTPNRNFHGKVRLNFAVAKLYVKRSFDPGSEIHMGRTEIQFGVNVRGPPMLTTFDTCLPPLPFQLAPSTNIPFKVSKIISDGKRSCSGSQQRDRRSLVMYSDEMEPGDVGFAIVQMPNREKDGHWEYKDKDGVFQRVQLPSRDDIEEQSSVLCLNPTSSIRFVPKNFSVIWSTMYAIQNIWLKIKLVSRKKDSLTGPCNITQDSMLFSKKQAQLTLPRKGCDGEPGLVKVQYDCRHCRGASGRCDEQPAPPVRKCQMRDCANKCYENGTLSENVEDSCGRCQSRRYFVNSRDCNGNCIEDERGERSKACINKCGFCVGGRTNRTLNHGMDSCGICNSSSACSTRLVLVSDSEVEINQAFQIFMKAEGFPTLRHATCSLYGASLSAGPTMSIGISSGTNSLFRKNLGKAKAWRGVIEHNNKHIENACDESTESFYHIKHDEVSLIQAGEYTLKCTVDNKAKQYNVVKGKFKAISNSAAINGFSPPYVEVGKAEAVIVKGSGFQNTTGLSCYFMQESSSLKAKIRAEFLNESAISCDLPRFKEPGEVLVNVLYSSAVRPTMSRSAPRLDVICSYPKAVRGSFKNGMRTLEITLDKHASLNAVRGKRRYDCEAFFGSKTSSKLNNVRCVLSGSRVYVFLPYNSKFMEGRNASKIKVWFNRENLRCKWPQHSRAMGPMTQVISVDIPNAQIKAVIMGEKSVDSCGKIVLSGSKSIFGSGGKRKYRWTLSEGSLVIMRSEGRSLFHVEGSKLKPNRDYKCKLCISDILGNENCALHGIRSSGNQSQAIHVRIPGSKFRRISASRQHSIRPEVSFIQCGRKKKFSEMNFVWQISPSDEGRIKGKDRRDLTIKPGDLNPKKNYTLTLLVTAIEEQMEMAQASVDLEVEGVPLKAKIRGGQEMTVGCYQKIVLDGSQSRDPALTNEAPVYVWECFDKDGRPCYKSSNKNKRLILDERKRIHLDVNGNLECNKSYIFNLTFSKGARSGVASILVKTRPGQPAEVKLDQRLDKKILILDGFIKTKSSAVADWSCPEGEGYDFLDLNDKSVVKYRGKKELKIRFNGRSAVLRQRLIIHINELPPNVKYQCKLEVQNSDGKSVAKTVVKSLSAPKKGDLKVYPSSGTAMNTSFSLSADEGWEDENNDYDYEIGFIEKRRSGRNKESILKKYSDKNFIDSIQLPPGVAELNFTLTVYCKVRNKQGLSTITTTDVQVDALMVMEKEKVKEALDSSNQAIAEQNYEKANQMIKTVLKTTESIGGNTLVEGGKSMKDNLTEQALTILKSADSTDRKITLSTLELTTKPGTNGIELKPETRKKVANATKNAVVEIPLTVNNVNAKRKRRSAENQQSSSAFTPKSKEEVDSVMTIFDNIIDENAANNQQDEKESFTSTTPSLLRSLCAGLIETGDFSISKNNLSTLRANRAAGETFSLNSLNLSDISNGPTVTLGAYLQQKYEQWNCSDSGLPCTELCVGSVLYHHDMYKGNFSGRIADIANVHLIHPDNYSFVDAGKLQSPIQLMLKLNEIPDSKDKIECRTWNSTNWTSEECVTHHSPSGFAVCNCTSISNITVFKVNVQDEAKEQLTTEISKLDVTMTSSSIETTPSSAHMSMSYLSKASMSQSVSKQIQITASKSMIGQFTPTLQPTPTELPSIQVVFSFPVDYNTYAADHKADALKQEIINMLSAKLQISKNRIHNLEIKPGSIIVSFTLMEASSGSNEDSLAAAKQKLENMAGSGALSVTLTDGTILTADPQSLEFGSSTPPPTLPQAKEPSKKPVLLIVTVTVLAVVLFVFLFARMYVVHKNRRTKVDPDRPNSAKVLMVDAIELEEKRKVAVAFEDSKEFEVSNISTENLVTVGIGSSSSLKRTSVADC